MTNLNVIGGNGSVEKLNLINSERPIHLDQTQFYLFHPPVPTENGKNLENLFEKRTGIEKEKENLDEKSNELTRQYDKTFKELLDVQRKPVNSPEEAEAKQQEIERLQEKINQIMEEKAKVEEQISILEKDIDNTNEEILEVVDLVIEDEHKINQQQQEIESVRKNIAIDDLTSQLFAA